MRISLIACALLLSAPALADDAVEEHGGLKLLCSSEPQREAELTKQWQEMGGRVIVLSVDDTGKLLDLINSKPPVTTLHADHAVLFRGQNNTILAVRIGDEFCMSRGSVDNATADQAIDEAIGRGL